MYICTDIVRAAGLEEAKVRELGCTINLTARERTRGAGSSERCGWFGAGAENAKKRKSRVTGGGPWAGAGGGARAHMANGESGVANNKFRSFLKTQSEQPMRACLSVHACPSVGYASVPSGVSFQETPRATGRSHETQTQCEYEDSECPQGGGTAFTGLYPAAGPEGPSWCGFVCGACVSKPPSTKFCARSSGSRTQKKQNAIICPSGRARTGAQKSSSAATSGSTAAAIRCATFLLAMTDHTSWRP